MARLEEAIQDLSANFEDFLRENGDWYQGKVTGIFDAHPSPALLSAFLSGDEIKKCNPVGIMFHGTHRNNIERICTEGLRNPSYVTNSLHYATRRSQFKEADRENPDDYPKEVKVLAMAVIVTSFDLLNDPDLRLKGTRHRNKLSGRPPREFSLPLFILTVKEWDST